MEGSLKMYFKIIWSQTLSSYFRYGSTISFIKNKEVRFENGALSPGASVVTWTSDANYNGTRSVLQLPLLERGKKYRLKLNGEVLPEKSILIKIDFLNRVSETVSSCFLKNNQEIFQYPEEAYYYKISILSMGMESLNFKEMILTEK